MLDQASFALLAPSSPIPQPMLRALRGAVLRPRSPQAIVLCLALWLTGPCNLALWRDLRLIGSAGGASPQVVAATAVLLFAATTALLSLTAWPRGMRMLWTGLLLLAAAAQHYMLSYGVVLDSGTVASAFQTDVREARDLLGWGLLGHLLLVAGPPALWLWRVPVRRGRWRSQLGRTALLLVASLAVAAATTLAGYRNVAPLVRNNMQLRHIANPISSIASALSVSLEPLRRRNQALVPISAGAVLGSSYAHQARPPLLVLVVGETARADHFGLNGYGRDTTPDLAARGVTSFANVRSCGTNTLASVPCMFSHFGKEGYEKRRADHENLLDVLQAAGLAVFWLDNQAGCKGVCERVPHASTADNLSAAAAAAHCDGDECRDALMLHDLERRLAALPAERRRRGVVLVMHQMGSHGPAYYKRSSGGTKRFLPECTDTNLAACDHADLVNAYDNTIVATDRFLGGTIDWLAGKAADFDTAMLYLSDHGESLGEYGLYLHGVPYTFAPEVQKHVPMVFWTSRAMAQRRNLTPGCLQQQRDAALTHDNLYHSVLGLLDVKTPTYHSALDAFGVCLTHGRGARSGLEIRPST